MSLRASSVSVCAAVFRMDYGTLLEIIQERDGQSRVSQVLLWTLQGIFVSGLYFASLVSDELLDEAADHFEAFFSEVFEELYKYGEVEDMVVCDNIGDHIIGNVYVKYSDDDAAKKALSALQGRYYAGARQTAVATFLISGVLV